MSGSLTARCVIAGGGPAGMVCGYLLARAGIDVIVLEKHADFLRDFRGDTVHPSTLEVFYELGLAMKATGRTDEARRAMDHVRELRAAELDNDIQVLRKR